MSVGYDAVSMATAVARTDDVLAERLRDRSLTIAVVGLGYTGLPVAHGFAAAGFAVRGIDIDRHKLSTLARGGSYLPDITAAQLDAVQGRFAASDDYETVRHADIVVVCVPTPLTDDGQPDLSALDKVRSTLAPVLAAGAVVILQSTVPPGTTRRWASRLAADTERVLGEDLFVAFAPERVNPANGEGWAVTNTPRVVGGSTPGCTRRAAAVLAELCPVVMPVSSPEVAEMAKLLENTARLVNISLSNEFSDVCYDLGIPVAEVIAAAATKPYGYLPHWPGPGIGGECIPVDPVFLLTDTRRRIVPMPVVETAYRGAVLRPLRVVDRVLELTAQVEVASPTRKVLVLGAAYKPNVSDTRNSPATTILAELHRVGVRAEFCDPLVPQLTVAARELSSVPLDRLALGAYQCVVLVTPHDAFDDLDWSHAAVVLDTVNRVPAGSNVERM